LGDVPQNSGFICAVGRFHQAKIFSRLTSAMPRSIQKFAHGEIQSAETNTSEKLTRKKDPGKNRSKQVYHLRGSPKFRACAILHRTCCGNIAAERTDSQNR
jgi:hypothetical protein